MDGARKSGTLPTAHRRARTRLESLLESRERARRRDHRPRLRHPGQGRRWAGLHAKTKAVLGHGVHGPRPEDRRNMHPPRA